jgi:hypothetical protein
MPVVAHSHASDDQEVDFFADQLLQETAYIELSHCAGDAPPAKPVT